jgi:CubicO group peptidase (beta-lactamase class C family)
MVNQSDSAFLAALYATPLVFPPGTRMEYGAGPFVLGVVATRVTGRPYAELIRDRIFRPLGMSGSYVNNPYARHPDAATG